MYCRSARPTVLLAVISAVLLSACDVEYVEPGPTPEEQFLADLRVPMQPGTTWEYRTEIEYHFASHSVYETINTQMEVLGYSSLPNGLEALEVEQRDVYSDGQEVMNATWFTNTPEGLYEEAYTLGERSIRMKNGQQKVFQVAGKRYHGLDELRAAIKGRRRDTQSAGKQSKTSQLVVHAEPLLSLPYPPELGTFWDNNDAGRLQQKEAVAVETLQLGNGSEHLALRVEVRQDLDGDGRYDPELSITQWYGQEGLLMETYRLENTLIYDPATDTEAMGDYIEHSTLIY